MTLQRIKAYSSKVDVEYGHPISSVHLLYGSEMDKWKKKLIADQKNNFNYLASSRRQTPVSCAR